MKRVCLVSLRFSPGHIQILHAYCNLFLRCGYELSVVFDEQYFNYLPNAKTFAIGIEQAVNCDVIWIYNPAPGNPSLARKARRNGKEVYYVYHEPYPGFKETLRNKTTILRGLLAILSSNLTCKYCTKVILPSMRCVELWKKYSLRINKNFCLFPLIYDKNEQDNDLLMTRTYFAFIGAFTFTHNSKGFVSFVKEASEKDKNIRFLIATKTDISRLISEDKDLDSLVRDGHIIVHCGKPMGMEDINRYYSMSICVWNNYLRCTQSGVMAQSFSNGTPVIASNLPAFTDYVKNGENGIILQNGSFEEIYEGYEHIKHNLSTMSANCRNDFEKLFDFNSQVSLMKSILG